MYDSCLSGESTCLNLLNILGASTPPFKHIMNSLIFKSDTRSFMPSLRAD